MATFVAGIMGALAQLWMGYMGDRLESKYGRRRPFIAILSILGGVAIISLMFPPAIIVANEADLIVWFFVFFTVVEVCRLALAPHSVWHGALVCPFHVRTHAHIHSPRAHACMHMLSRTLGRCVERRRS
jgi:Na+/melibiose symporter-like transporter